MRYGPQRSGIIVCIYVLQANTGLKVHFTINNINLKLCTPPISYGWDKHDRYCCNVQISNWTFAVSCSANNAYSHSSAFLSIVFTSCWTRSRSECIARLAHATSCPNFTLLVSSLFTIQLSWTSFTCCNRDRGYTNTIQVAVSICQSKRGEDRCPPLYWRRQYF